MESLTESLRAKYKLSEESEKFLLQRINPLANGEDSRDADSQTSNEGLEFEYQGSRKEFSVPSVSSPGGVPVEVFKPKGCPGKPGILVNFHSGETSSRRASDLMCAILASELRCVVVNTEYRLAPEHKFPALFDDAKCVTRWVLMNKSLLGAQHDSKVGVCGSHLGGGLAATVAFEVPSLDFQILAYPFVDWRVEGENYTDVHPVEKEMIQKLVNETIQNPDDMTNVRASPLLQPNFARLPPTLVLLAECDGLKEAGQAFKCKVKAANVTCEGKLMKGAVRGFFSSPASFKETNRQCREVIAKFFKKNGSY